MADITLKDDYTFLVSDSAGEVQTGMGGHGLYYEDTRYLSCLTLLIDGQPPQLLSQQVEYNIAATFRLSSAYLARPEIAAQPLANTIGLTRRRFIRNGLIESLEFTSYHIAPVQLTLALRLEADFADIFEVRGVIHQLEGRFAHLGESSDPHILTFYSVPQNPAIHRRFLRVESSRPPARLEEAEAVSPVNKLTGPQLVLHYTFELQPNRSQTLDLRFFPGVMAHTPDPDEATGGHETPVEHPAKPASIEGFGAEVVRTREIFTRWQQACTRVRSNDYLTNQLFETSTLDLRSLMQQEAHGLVVTAGLPWYFTLFGRDSLIASLQTLPLNPQIAVDTLRVLASYQAVADDPWRDMEPGKILHELRRGDLTRSGQMPHGPYYGSVDSTLLFILLFCETLRWLDDGALFAELWPNVERALAWAEQSGEIDGDGYIKFKRRSERGILHPGWKDSDESMGGALGPRPQQPIALVEVQGYYYDALLKLAQTLRLFGNAAQTDLADRLTTKAARLKANFERDFWWPEEGFLYQALDEGGKPVRSLTSNPGHCLWSGILEPDKAGAVADRLMQPDLLCGWGIRTMSNLDPTYNPMSYHNGSVWPHDNSIILAGLRRYGFERHLLQLADQLLDAGLTYPEARLPELYCGFAREDEANQTTEHAPAAYPVSCSPQAWAAGTPFLLLQALLGLEPDARNSTLSLAPKLLNRLSEVTLQGLRLGDSQLDLYFKRDEDSGKITLNYTQPSAHTPVTIKARL